LLLPFALLILSAPTPSLFPYTTLFRSQEVPGVLLLGRSSRFRLRGLPDHVLWSPALRRLRSPDPDLRSRRDHHPAESLSRPVHRSEEHTSELQSRENLACRLLLEKKKI